MQGLNEYGSCLARAMSFIRPVNGNVVTYSLYTHYMQNVKIDSKY